MISDDKRDPASAASWRRYHCNRLAMGIGLGALLAAAAVLIGLMAGVIP